MIEKIPVANKGNDLYGQIRSILNEARSLAYWAVNFAMGQAYWRIGMLIVEHEHAGEPRAEYGKGYLVQNLRYMRQFCMLFRKQHALRPELSWTHYR